jgi:hypothetical protein
MRAWLDDNCGAYGWEITPAGLRGVINDAIAVYFRGAALAGRLCRALARSYSVGAGVFKSDKRRRGTN